MGGGGNLHDPNAGAEQWKGTWKYNFNTVSMVGRRNLAFVFLGFYGLLGFSIYSYKKRNALSPEEQLKKSLELKH